MPNLIPKNILEFFHLQSALDSEFFRGDVWVPIFFGHTKFGVKNFTELFNLQTAVDPEFFLGELGTIFFWSCYI